MQIVIRASLLGIFAAAGMGLAVSFAVLNEASPVAQPTAETNQAAQSTPGADAAPEAVAVVDRVGTAPPEKRPSPPPIEPLAQGHFAPWPVAYHSPVASRLSGIQDAIESIQDHQEETTQAVRELQEELPRSRAMTPPPAPVDSPADAGRVEPKIQLSEGDEDLVIDLQNSDIREVLKLISEASGLNILISPNVTGSVSASLQGVDIETALDAILKSSGLVARRDGDFIFVGTPTDLDEMDQKQDRVDTRIYRPDFVTADELQKLLTPLLTEGLGTVVVSTTAEEGIESDKTNAGGDAFAGGDVLLVRDYETVLQHVDSVVAAVDIRPRQVVIETMILSVKLDDKNELGVDFELLRNRDTIRVVSGSPLNTLATADFEEGLKVGFLDSSTFAFLQALESIGETSVIATPRVMCLNKQRAEIHIGSELGYVSTTVTETAALQNVEFLEVGTNLNIRPYISSDNVIRMEVHPELSTGSVRVEEGFTLPDKEVTQVTTNVMCPDRATVVIGGLIREDLVTTASQIPVLGSLPWVGVVFRQRTEEIDRREIIVLLTPRIVDISEMRCEGERNAQQSLDRRNVFADKMSPLSKRHWAERYFRLATAAWAAGDADIALRYSNLAIHFDPLHQDAINLRREIVTLHPNLEPSVDEHLHRGLRPFALPHRDYSRHGFPWQAPPVDDAYFDIRSDGYQPGQPVEVIELAPAGE
ncbi:MAG: secretin and TonB N-terminal domain-containing protein, partial [Pirellulaceae bacterium]